MADILFLRGAPAFSAFRLQGLQQRLQAVVSTASLLSADYWHLVKLKTALSDEERQQLASLLEERVVEGADGTQSSQLFFVTPRIGTISPWSSKATDIAWNCGLAAIERIERGIAYRIAGVSSDARGQLVALLHDRMIETVLPDFAPSAELFRHFPPKPIASVDVPGGGLDVLLVEDVPINQEVLRDMLESAGIRVRLAGNGYEALKSIALNPPDCVLMDCQMPLMDGYEATRKLRKDKRYSKLPIIALASTSLLSERERCGEAGMDGVLAKPVRARDLFAVLAEYFPSRVASQAAVTVAQNAPEETGVQKTVDMLPYFPGIDSQLGLRYANSNSVIYRKLLFMFCDIHGRNFEPSFRSALKDGNWKETTRLIHSLKSSAKMIGATELGAQAEVLEEVCHAQQRKAISPLLTILLRDLNRVVAGLADVKADGE